MHIRAENRERMYIPGKVRWKKYGICVHPYFSQKYGICVQKDILLETYSFIHPFSALFEIQHSEDMMSLLICPSSHISHKKFRNFNLTLPLISASRSVSNGSAYPHLIRVQTNVGMLYICMSPAFA